MAVEHTVRIGNELDSGIGYDHAFLMANHDIISWYDIFLVNFHRSYEMFSVLSTKTSRLSSVPYLDRRAQSVACLGRRKGC